MPSAASILAAIALSMAKADASTPEPTYGMPTISSMPWSVPSSPQGPCSAMKATSMRRLPSTISMASVAGAASAAVLFISCWSAAGSSRLRSASTSGAPV